MSADREHFACDACLRRAALLARLAPRIAGLLDRPRPRLHGLLALEESELLAAVAADRADRSPPSSTTSMPTTSASACPAPGRGVCHHSPATRHFCSTSTTRPRCCSAWGASSVDSCTRSGVRSSAPATRARTAPRSPIHWDAAWAPPACGGERPRARHRRPRSPGLWRAGGSPSPCCRRARRRVPAASPPPSPAGARDRTGLSELPPGTQPYRWSFPARNRIMAGLARMTVVVEALIPVAA